MWTSWVRTLPTGRYRVFARENDILPTLPNANLRYQELGQVRNTDKRQHGHCFLSAHFAKLSRKVHNLFSDTWLPILQFMLDLELTSSNLRLSAPNFAQRRGTVS